MDSYFFSKEEVMALTKKKLNLERTLQIMREKRAQAIENFWRLDDLNPDIQAIEEEIEITDHLLAKIEGILARSIVIARKKATSVVEVRSEVSVQIWVEKNSEPICKNIILQDISIQKKSRPYGCVVTPDSPLGKTLLGKTIGEEFVYYQPKLDKSLSRVRCKIIKIA